MLTEEAPRSGCYRRLLDKSPGAVDIPAIIASLGSSCSGRVALSTVLYLKRQVY